MAYARTFPPTSRAFATTNDVLGKADPFVEKNICPKLPPTSCWINLVILAAGVISLYFGVK